MKIKAEQFNTGDLYQLMAYDPRKAYEIMPPWDILVNKLYKRAKVNISYSNDFTPVNRVIITESPFEDNENGVDFIVFIDSQAFLKKENFRLSISNIHFETTSSILNKVWNDYLNKNPHHFIDRLVLIDDGTIVQESSIEGQKMCLLLYKHYYGNPEDIELCYITTSFHQYALQKYYFGEEFREYLSVSDTDVNNAILAYGSCLIPIYLVDMSHRNYLENLLYEAVGNVMRAIEEEDNKKRPNTDCGDGLKGVE